MMTRHHIFFDVPKNRTGNRNGFTLIELLVVIAIIDVLASVVLVGMQTAITKAEAARALSTGRSFSDAVYIGCVVDDGSTGIPILTDANFTPGSTICGITVPNDPSGNRFSLISSASGQVVFRFGNTRAYALCAVRDKAVTGPVSTVCPDIDYPGNCLATPADGVVCSPFYHQ